MSALNTPLIVKQKAVVKAFSEFNIENETFEFFVYNFSNKYEGLIGNDILRKYKSIIDFEKDTLTLNNVTLPLHIYENPKSIIQIRPGEHLYKIPVSTETGNIIINNIHINNEITIDEGLYTVQNSETCIKINNATKNDLVVEVDKLLQTEVITEIHNVNKLPVKINNANIDFDSILKNIRTNHLNAEERRELKILIESNIDIISNDNEKLTFTHEIKHNIITKDEIPIKSKIYRYPYIHKNEIQKQITEMLSNGIITPSSSPYNSPVWVVPKKADASGIKKFRLVID